MSSDDAPTPSGTKTPERPRVGGRRWGWLVAGIAIGIFGLGIRGCLHQQPVNSDDIQYFTLAQQMSVPSPSNVRFETPRTGLSPNSLRLAFLAVPAGAAALMGDGSEAFYTAVYAIAVLSFIGVFALAWVLVGPRAGVIAAAIWATSYAAIAVDTRLVPDNLGTALALIGLALIGQAACLGRDREAAAQRSRRRRVVYAAIGGFLLWAAFSTRASFFIFALVGVAFALLGRDRWVIVAAVAAGGLLGELAELLYFAASFGDPFVRWRALFGFGASMSGAGTNPDSVYAGYTAADLFIRYPRILWATDSAEVVLHFAGLAVFAWWAVGWRQPQRLAKAICGLAVYGCLAFAITGVDPVVPLMREKLRYYATAAPLFYIAVAELIDAVLFHPVRPERLRRWLNGRPRLVAAAVLVTAGIAANLAMGADSPQFARNGNDGLLTAAEVLEEDAPESDRPRVLYQDMRTARVMSILLSLEDGWRGASGYDSYLGTDFRIREDGYLLLNWKRLNANVRRSFGHAPRTHNYYRIIEGHPLVARHRRGGELVDLFFISRDTITREITAIDEGFPAGWRRLDPATNKDVPLSPDEPARSRGRYREYVYSGGGGYPKPPPGTRLTGEEFVEVRLEARAEHMTRIRAYLLWWPQGSTRPENQYMGTVWVGPELGSYAMWTYLPEDARAHRLVLRPDEGAMISTATTHVLSVHPSDRIRQFGGAWPRAVPDKALVAAADRIRADAERADRTPAIYDELPADRVINLQPDGWALRSREVRRGVVAPPADCYLMLSWERLREEARADFDSARIHRYYRSLDDAVVVFRHADKVGFTDVFFAPPDPVARPVLSEDRAFPDGWSRLLNSTKAWSPLAGAHEIAFASRDPDDEYIYSGDGPVWRATARDTATPGDRFVQVIADVRADRVAPLRAALFWWPDGSREPRRQAMGALLAGPEPKQLAWWTYLPAHATSHRVVFRAAAGVRISNVRTRSLGRLEGDRVEQRGGAW